MHSSSGLASSTSSTPANRAWRVRSATNMSISVDEQYPRLFHVAFPQMRVLLDRAGAVLALALEVDAGRLQSGDAVGRQLVLGKPQPLQVADVRAPRQQP